jgi:hypothetical protein
MNKNTRKQKRLLPVLGLVALFLIGGRLLLPTLIKNYVNKQLGKDPIYHGSIQDVELNIWKGSGAGTGLNITRVDGQKTYPFVSANRIEGGLSWRDLFRGSVVARVHIDTFEVNLVKELKKKDGKQKSEVSIGAESDEAQAKEIETWQEIAKNLMPLDIGRLTVDDGKIHYRDLTSRPQLDIYVDKIHVIGQNLTNSQKVSDNLFGTIDVHARIMKSGDFNLHLYINPLSSPFEFKANVKLADLNLTELNGAFTEYGGFDVKKGKFSLYSEMATANKKVEGYFKPLMEDLEVAHFEQDKKKGIAHAVWEQVVEVVGGVFKNHSKDRQGAKIPFSGRLDNPKIGIWATFTSILQNIFIRPISPHLEHSVDLNDVKSEKKKSDRRS